MPRWNRWQTLVHLVAPLPLLYLVWAYRSGALGVNPIQMLTLRTGLLTLILLTLTLAVTPLQRFLRLRGIVRARRPLGLYTFAYATAHMLTFIGLDYGFDWGLLWREIVTQKPYVQIGLLAYGLLALLAVTSPRAVMRRLGARWKTLHRLIYLIGGLAIVHYAWVVKGNVSTFQGNVVGPVGYGLVIGGLLAARWVRRPRARRAPAGQNPAP